MKSNSKTKLHSIEGKPTAIYSIITDIKIMVASSQRLVQLFLQMHVMLLRKCKVTQHIGFVKIKKIRLGLYVDSENTERNPYIHGIPKKLKRKMFLKDVDIHWSRVVFQ